MWPVPCSSRWALKRTFPRRRPSARCRAASVNPWPLGRGAMHFDSDLIILDEPTNNLGVAETQGVLRFVRNARDSGHSCIFIAHNIHHVFSGRGPDRGAGAKAASSPTTSTPRRRPWPRWSRLLRGMA